MFLLRWFIGRIILLLDFIFTPRAPKRAPHEQAKIDESTEHLSLYQLPACPFCVKVRRSMKRNGLKVELVNINKTEEKREELINEGGSRKVPCLKIVDEDKQVKWLYESNDIVNYLQQYAR